MRAQHYLNCRWRQGFCAVVQVAPRITVQMEDIGRELGRTAVDGASLDVRRVPGLGTVGTLFGSAYLFVERRRATWQHSILAVDKDPSDQEFQTIFYEIYGGDTDRVIHMVYNLLSTLEHWDGGPLVQRLVFETPPEDVQPPHVLRVGALVEAVNQRWPQARGEVIDVGRVEWDALVRRGPPVPPPPPPVVESIPEPTTPLPPDAASSPALPVHVEFEGRQTEATRSVLGSCSSLDEQRPITESGADEAAWLEDMNPNHPTMLADFTTSRESTDPGPLFAAPSEESSNYDEISPPRPVIDKRVLALPALLLLFVIVIVAWWTQPRAVTPADGKLASQEPTQIQAPAPESLPPKPVAPTPVTNVGVAQEAPTPPPPPATCLVDRDGDGVPFELKNRSADAHCKPFTTSKRDCDDTNAAVNPDAPARCNGLDNNCDGEVECEGGGKAPTDVSTWTEEWVKFEAESANCPYALVQFSFSKPGEQLSQAFLKTSGSMHTAACKLPNASAGRPSDLMCSGQPESPGRVSFDRSDLDRDALRVAWTCCAEAKLGSCGAGGDPKLIPRPQTSGAYSVKPEPFTAPPN